MLTLWYFTGLFLSITGYRLCFHPLRKFPGPFVAKLSKTIYGPYMNRSGKMHLEQDEMHQKYGDFIRTGPNELCIFSPSAHNKIHGPHSQCSKAGTPYEALTFNGEPNLDSMVDHDTHRWRRQIWDKALASTTALNQYESTVRRVVQEWLAKINTLHGQSQPIDTSLFSVLIGMEIGGQVGYSKELGVVKVGKQNTLQHLLEQLFGGVSALGHLAWPIFLAQGLGYKGDLGKFEDAVIEMTEERDLKSSSSGRDSNIMQHLLDDYNSPKPKFFTNRNMLYADAELILTASTETIGATMSYAFYYLAQQPLIQNQLREELIPLFGKTIPGEFAAQDLGEKSATYLCSVIDETLRLHNPTLNEIQRRTPPQGIDIDGVHVPGDVLVSASVYSMNRSERFFKRALEFIPERWTTQKDLIIGRGAFYPFLEGKAAGISLSTALRSAVLTWSSEPARCIQLPRQEISAHDRQNGACVYGILLRLCVCPGGGRNSHRQGIA
jgi:tryprostatin B 6-hydroxylase